MTTTPTYERGSSGGWPRRPHFSDGNPQISGDHLLLARFVADAVPGTHEHQVLNTDFPEILRANHVKGVSPNKIEVIARGELAKAAGPVDRHTELGRRVLYHRIFPNGVKPQPCEISGISVVGVNGPKDHMTYLDYVLTENSWAPLVSGRGAALGNISVRATGPPPHMRFALTMPRSRAEALEKELSDQEAGFFPLRCVLLVPEWYSTREGGVREKVVIDQ